MKPLFLTAALWLVIGTPALASHHTTVANYDQASLRTLDARYPATAIARSGWAIPPNSAARAQASAQGNLPVQQQIKSEKPHAPHAIITQ